MGCVASASPSEERLQLQKEAVLVAEGCHGSVTYRNFSAPGKRFGWKKTWVRNASIYVLNDKVAYFSGNRRLGNVEFADARFQHLQSSVEDGSVLLLCNEDCSIFNPKMSGSVDVRISTANAADLHAMLLSHQQERC
ncbi:unnamed protein product [Symbiodinium natans]|uniref:PH domain-containing protein n=1 Tax=Symbiodinium natans TaxID=878477 RepID=A0A812S960_9DINO|nr:unnamed protein product [Symbiodinium natans]